MVEQIIITPGNVRGLGNIVAEKTADDFNKYLSTLSLNKGLYTLVYDNKTLLINVSQAYVKSGGTITVTVTLLDENSNPMQGEDIELFKEDNFYDS